MSAPASPAAAVKASKPAVAKKPPVPTKPPLPPKPTVAPVTIATSEPGTALAFGNRLKGLAWRVDVKTKSKHIKELNEPVAIVELDVKGSEGHVVRFEMDAAQVKDVVGQLSRIEAAINSA